MSKLSIIMPVYNNAQMSKDAILNIYDVCEWLDYELIVIDDASTDDTFKVLMEIFNDKTEYIVSSKNVGVTKVWNHWASIAVGDYICIINNDVIFPKWFFENMMQWFHEWVVMVNPRFTEWNKDNPSQLMYFKNHICGHCYMFKLEDRDRLFPIDTRFRIFGNDNWLWHRIDEIGGKQCVKHDAICHHLKSQTVFNIPNEDRKIYLDMCLEEWWQVPVVYPLPTNELTEDFIF
jgi:glycosyltransferase involved in cell wall biosynthesis